MDPTDQPNSLYHIQSIHMYPLQHAKVQVPIPFGLLPGEMTLYSGNSVEGLIIVTNYRLFIQNGENQHHIPLGLVESIEIKELFYLHLFCKDARTYRCAFENNESAIKWYERLLKAIEPPRQIDQVFAFYYCIWTKEKGGEDLAIKIEKQNRYIFGKDMFDKEINRMQFQGDSWRITKVNNNFQLCPSYPPYLLVPSCINDEMLESVAKFRSSRRIPTAVWRHTRNGAIIARCSQPEVGWLGWRSSEDEDLLKAISEACTFNQNSKNNSSDKDSVLSHSPGSLHSDESLQITCEVLQQEKKLLIIDARSYTTAVANRARGGGCECPEYYPNCEIQFMNLANIHSIRKSFNTLRQLCMSSPEITNWFSQLEGTRWLLHISGLMKAAVILTTAVERDGRPVLVHCSDGWDRTPQIVALAELLLDPYYRTVDGFRVLIEREWLAFGHKFADRCGHCCGSEDQNERCPVFVQWLDCVHQLIMQFPVSFEFSHNYLIKLVQHTYSNLYGTFLCNSQKERSKLIIDRTFSVWDLLSSPFYKNNLFAAHFNTASIARVLWPKTNIRDLRLWTEVYLGSMEINCNSEEVLKGTCPGPPQLNSQANMSKTRSYGDLVGAETFHTDNNGRRSSDPNINTELNLLQDEKPTAAAINNKSNQIECKYDKTTDIFPNDLYNSIECNPDCIFNSHSHSTPNLTDDQIDKLCIDSENDLAKTESFLVSTEILKPPSSPLTSNGEIIRSQINITHENRDCDNVAIVSSVNQKEQHECTIQVCHNLPHYNKGIHSDKFKLYGLQKKNYSPRCNGGTRNDNSNLKNIKGMNRSSDTLERFFEFENSVETSTETLVSEQPFCENSEKSSQSRWNADCFQSFCYRSQFRPCNYQLGEDGLIRVRSPIQERLDQILEEQSKKVDLLEKELHASRQYLIEKVCHKCYDIEKQEDSGSVVESLNSVSEGQVSAGESLRSDMSWVAVEEGSVGDCQGTLWVPDHAVNKCTSCGTEFWLGRRRHHCRKCGKIFCADCSEHATPLPSEQLYNPVRVCTSCYSELSQINYVESNCKSTETFSGRCQERTLDHSAEQKRNTQIAAISN